MKNLLFLLMIAHTVCAQTPVQSNPPRFFRRDSLPDVLPALPTDLMPNARSHNSLYRNPADPPNVLRATLDNMPIKVPDSSTYYSALRPQQNYFQPKSPPLRFRRPIPRK